MNARIWRWRYVVDWNLQGSLVVHGLLYGVLVLLAVSFGIFSPLLWDLTGDPQDARLDEQSIVMLYLHERFWLLAGICLFVVVLGAIRFSHRVAGPMVRYKRNLRLLAQGGLPPALRTRRSDYLKEEVACLNDAVEGVAKRADAIRQAQLEMRRELTALLDRAPDRERELAPLLAACDRLEAKVREFRHVDPGDERLPVAVAAARREGVAAAPQTGGA